MNKALKNITSFSRLKGPAIMAIILAIALNPGTPWRD